VDLEPEHADAAMELIPSLKDRFEEHEIRGLLEDTEYFPGNDE
jgi:hypothetical protein